MSSVHPQRAALVLQQVGDVDKLGISSALDIACGAGGRERSVLVPTGERLAILGRIRPRGLVAGAVILQQVRALGKLDAVRAIAVVDRSTTFRTQVGGDGRRERTAGNSDGLSGVVESRLLLHRVLQLIPTVIDDEPAPKSFL